MYSRDNDTFTLINYLLLLRYFTSFFFGSSPGRFSPSSFAGGESAKNSSSTHARVAVGMTSVNGRASSIKPRLAIAFERNSWFNKKASSGAYAASLSSPRPGKRNDESPRPSMTRHTTSLAHVSGPIASIFFFVYSLAAFDALAIAFRSCSWRIFRTSLATQKYAAVLAIGNHKGRFPSTSFAASANGFVRPKKASSNMGRGAGAAR
mmetsp:Transcript_11813/g.43933  ORF Transcript_11813/g.43933 Transcript_11813/m.43933 type:complete len:207 (+) Transcript_11813:4213-4833(+)